MGNRRYGILSSCASAAVADDLVAGSFSTLAEALAEMKRVLASQPGLEGAPVVKAYPGAVWLGLDGYSTVQQIIRRHWS